MGLILLGGCGGNGTAEQDEIKVGAVLSLDGEYTHYGVPVSNGIKMAVEELNREGGINGVPFKIDIRNSHSDPAEAAAAMGELLANGCRIIIGADTTDLTAELIQLAAEKEVILISPSATSPSLRRIKSNGFFFRVCPTDDNEAEKIALELPRAHRRFPFIKRPINRVFTLVLKNSAYTDGLWNAFGRHLYKLQTDNTNFSYEHMFYMREELQSEPDEGGSFNEQMQEILAKVADYQIDEERPENSGAVVIFGFSADVQILLKVFKQRGLKLNLYTSSSVDTADFLHAAPEFAEGLVFPRVFDPNKTDDEQVVKFVNTYKTKFGTEPDLYAAYGYDTAMLIGLTLRRENIGEFIADPRNFRLQMNDVRFNGLTGRIDFDQQNNEVIKNFLLYKLVGGKTVFIDDYENQLEMEKYREMREMSGRRGTGD